MTDQTKPVRFVCTDQGQHTRRVLRTVRLTRDSVEEVHSTRSTAPFNRRGGEALRRKWRDEDRLGALPDFDLLCPTCRRNPRLTAARMRTFVLACLKIHPDTPGAVIVDISGPLGRIIC